MKKIFLFATIALLWISCGNYDDSTDDFGKDVSQPSGYSLLETSALNFAKSIKELEPQTRAAVQNMSVRGIKQMVFPTTGRKTRTADEETSCYAVNMNEGNGVVIIAKKGDSIQPLAYFMNEDSVNVNPAEGDDTDVDLLLCYLSGYGHGSDPIIDNKKDNRTIDDGESGGGIPQPQKSGKPQIIKKVAPKYKVSWNQGYPYNKYCYAPDQEPVLAGCVAIAGAQALTVLRPNIPGIISSWDEVCKPNPTPKAIHEIAYLVNYIGKGIKTNYGTKSSSAKYHHLISFLKQYGDIVECSTTRIIETLDTEHGVMLASGYRARHGSGVTRHYVDGHAFIADGYVRYSQMEHPLFVHVNYGWGAWYTNKTKDAYILNLNKTYTEDAYHYFPVIFPHHMTFSPYTRRSEITWD
ncbi:MAG: C10 family peptidase [Hoylesella marshii]|uniref:C10 family peptidase n=1 Tax=Hoylesella marshii TaxID=189722 RepID=UPI003F9EC23A